jgi:hypothetical protein
MTRHQHMHFWGSFKIQTMAVLQCLLVMWSWYTMFYPKASVSSTRTWEWCNPVIRLWRVRITDRKLLEWIIWAAQWAKGGLCEVMEQLSLGSLAVVGFGAWVQGQFAEVEGAQPQAGVGEVVHDIQHLCARPSVAFVLTSSQKNPGV